MLRNRVLAITVVALTIVAAGCSQSGTPSSSAPGVSDKSINLAETASLTGNFAAISGPFVASAKMVFTQANDNGGVNGRSITWNPVDDGGDIQRAVTQAQRIATGNDTFAAVLPLGTAATIAKAQVYGSSGVPYVTLGTSRAVTTKDSFGSSTSYYTQTKAAVGYAIDKLGAKDVGILVYETEDGNDVSAGATDALSARGMKPVGKVQYAAGTTDFSAQLNTLAQAKYIVIYGSTPDSARVVQAVARANLKVKIISPEPAFDATFVKLAGQAAEGTLVASPFLPLTSSAPGIAEYKTSLAKYAPGVQPTFWGLMGYQCAKVTVKALEMASKDLTRAKFITALGSIKNFDSGVHAPVSLAEGKPADGGTMLYEVKDGSYTPLTDNFITADK